MPIIQVFMGVRGSLSSSAALWGVQHLPGNSVIISSQCCDQASYISLLNAAALVLAKHWGHFQCHGFKGQGRRSVFRLWHTDRRIASKFGWCCVKI